MILKTLYGKLALALVGLLSLLGVVYGAFNLYSSQLFLQELNQRFNRDLARQLLVQRDLASGTWLDKEAIADLFSYYMHINPAIEIYLLDTEGKILAFEAPQMQIKRERVDLEPIRRFLSGEEAYPILGDDPRDTSSLKTFSAAAIPMQGPPRQYLYVVLSGEDYDSLRALLQDSYFLQVSTLAVAGSILFGLFAGLFVFNLLTRRLHRLTTVMEAFRGSNFQKHSPYAGGRDAAELIRRGDEIDALGGTFDQMAETLIEQMQALEDKDRLRRNLVANVSHDLRTPLAALQGYLETLLLKTEELPVEKRREYLSTAFKQSERLTQLVGELFELSRLDAAETRPQLEPLALGELAHDVAQKVQLEAEAQQLAFHMAIPPDLPLVQADIKMLNRVLENLLANALAHTPEGGEVRLSLRQVAAGVEVAVTNSGPPIAADDLPHVFERFYQAPHRRSGSGAGLGLAIVKRILELHGAAIEVASDSERGTRFSFTLPAA